MTNSYSRLAISSGANIKPFVEFFEQKQIDWRSIARECNLPEEMTDNWLSSRETLLFLHRMAQEHGQDLGAQIALRLPLEGLVPDLDSLLSHCDTLGDGLDVLISVFPTLNNHVQVWVEQNEQGWWLCHHAQVSSKAAGFEQAEWFRTLMLIAYCRRFLGEAWQPRTVHFACQHTSGGAMSSSMLGASLSFDHDYGQIAIELEQGYSPLKPSLDFDWLQTISRLIQTYATLPWCSIQWFAGMLGTTPRSLQRQLKAQGAGFREIREAARFDHAKQLLEISELPTHEIAWQCGYTDLANFNRAFRRWSGITPPAYRKQQRKQ